MPIAQPIRPNTISVPMPSPPPPGRLNPPPLALPAFAYLAFRLSRLPLSGAQLLAHPDWGLFFLEPNATERLFIAADGAGLLTFEAAGAVIRVHFPAESLEDYAWYLTHARYQPAP